jgi:hypothetical protein
VAGGVDALPRDVTHRDQPEQDGEPGDLVVGQPSAGTVPVTRLPDRPLTGA